MTTKGLTGIREVSRGFVGNRPNPVYDTTIRGRPRIRFDIACGKPEENVGKFATWRHCVGYDVIAQKLKSLKVGDLVSCQGWVSTEWMKDEYQKPILDDEGRYRTKEYLILFQAEVILREKTPVLQPVLSGITEK